MKWPDPQRHQTTSADVLEAQIWGPDDLEDQERKPGDGEHQPQVGLLQRCRDLLRSQLPTGRNSSDACPEAAAKLKASYKTSSTVFIFKRRSRTLPETLKITMFDGVKARSAGKAVTIAVNSVVVVDA